MTFIFDPDVKGVLVKDFKPHNDFDEGYEFGVRVGKILANDDQPEVVDPETFSEDEKAFYDLGYDNGVNQMPSEALDTYDDGYDHGYDEGYHDGFDVGFDEGHSAGFDEGFDSCEALDDEIDDLQNLDDSIDTTLYDEENLNVADKSLVDVLNDDDDAGYDEYIADMAAQYDDSVDRSYVDKISE